MQNVNNGLSSGGLLDRPRKHIICGLTDIVSLYSYVQVVGLRRLEPRADRPVHLERHTYPYSHVELGGKNAL